LSLIKKEQKTIQSNNVIKTVKSKVGYNHVHLMNCVESHADKSV
jgi:hypothetical protein